MRNEIVKMAESWIGCKESDGSHKQIIDVYNRIKPLPAGYKLSYTDAWCAAFVSVSAAMAGCTNIVFPECSCDRMIALYKKAGRWQENDAYTPKKGDIIFYDWQDSGSGDNTGSSDHVGIVTEVSGKTITVIEGNMSDEVRYRTISVNAKYIRGYGVPNYENSGAISATTTTAASTTTNKTVTSSKSVSVKVRQLSKGMSGEDVKALQLLLKGKGFSIGSAGADGDFGSNTYNAVKSFQTKNKLTSDGICGSKTWDAIING